MHRGNEAAALYTPPFKACKSNLRLFKILIVSLCSLLHLKVDICWTAGNRTEPKGREYGAKLSWPCSRLWKKSMKRWKTASSTDIYTSGITATELYIDLSHFDSVPFTVSRLRHSRGRKIKRKCDFCSMASTNLKLVDICSGDWRAAWTPCISIKDPCPSKGLVTQRSPTHVERNELININGKSSNDNEMWDLPGSLEPDSIARRFPSKCFGMCL